MKPLKRFARFFLPLITGLKPGVNEMSQYLELLRQSHAVRHIGPDATTSLSILFTVGIVAFEPDNFIVTFESQRSLPPRS